MVGVYSPTLSPWLAWTSYGLEQKLHVASPYSHTAAGKQRLFCRPVIGAQCAVNGRQCNTHVAGDSAGRTEKSGISLMSFFLFEARWGTCHPPRSSQSCPHLTDTSHHIAADFHTQTHTVCSEGVVWGELMKFTGGLQKVSLPPGLCSECATQV